MFIVVLAREEEEDAVLTCNTTADKAVTWKFKGNDVMFESNYKKDGQRLNVSVDQPLFGEYSCWSEGQMLSSVYLLLEGKESGEIFFFISHSSYHSFKYQSLFIYNFIISFLVSSHYGLYRFSVPLLGKIL